MTDWKAIQTEINAAGYTPALVVDGILGPRTRAGMRWLAAQRAAAPWADAVPGIDVSGWQDRVDWEKVRAAGNRWAAIKLTQDESAANADAGHQSAGARAALDLVMPYHWPKPSRARARDAEREAAAFLRECERHGPWSGPPAYDLEEGENRKGVTSAKAIADDEYNLLHVVTWLDLVEDGLGLARNTALVYFGKWSLDLFINRAVRAGTSPELVARFVARPGWQADYHPPAKAAHPLDDPFPWLRAGIQIHQWAGAKSDPNARVPGVKGACDRNRMRAEFFERLTGRCA